MCQLRKSRYNSSAGLNKPSLFDLFLMHAEGRGTLVDDSAQADTIFDVFSGTVTAFDTDKILSDFLA